MDKRSINEKNVDVIVAREEAKKKKRQMKEKTGNKEVDELMEEFENVTGSKFGENIGKKDGGMLKAVKPNQKGLAKLPKAVRNKMGYMKDGGRAKFPDLEMITFKYQENVSHAELIGIAQAKLKQCYRMVVANRGEEHQATGAQVAYLVTPEQPPQKAVGKPEIARAIADYLEAII